MAVTNRLGAVLLASMLAAAAMVLVLVGPGPSQPRRKYWTRPPRSRARAFKPFPAARS
jgi:hypothetical protein